MCIRDSSVVVVVVVVCSTGDPEGWRQGDLCILNNTGYYLSETINLKTDREIVHKPLYLYVKIRRQITF